MPAEFPLLHTVLTGPALLLPPRIPDAQKKKKEGEKEAVDLRHLSCGGEGNAAQVTATSDPG